VEKICVVLIGNIGSGKSTLSKGLIEAGYVAVSHDQIRYAIGNGQYTFKPEFEQAVHDITMCTFYKFMGLEQNLVIDETNVTPKIRENYIWAAKNRGYTVIAIEMPKLSREESLTRRISKNHCEKYGEDVWGPVWERFNGRYQAPTIEEGFDVVVKLTGDSDPSDAIKIVETSLKGLQEHGG